MFDTHTYQSLKGKTITRALLFLALTALLTGNTFAAPAFSYYSYDQDDKGRALGQGTGSKIYIDHESNRLFIGGKADPGTPGSRYAVATIDPLDPANGTVNVDGDEQDEPSRTGSDDCWDFEFCSGGRFAGVGYTNYEYLETTPYKMSIVTDTGVNSGTSFDYYAQSDDPISTFGYGVTSRPGTNQYIVVGSRHAEITGDQVTVGDPANMDIQICIVDESSPTFEIPINLEGSAFSTQLAGGKSALDVLYVEDHIDGDYLLICGRTNVRERRAEPSASDAEPFVLRTDLSGEVAWVWLPENLLSVGNNKDMDVSYDLWVGNDGNIMVAGQYLHSDENFNGFLAKIRPDKTLPITTPQTKREIYVESYNTPGGNEVIRGGACRPGGGYVLVGYQFVKSGQPIDAFVKLVDENGNELNHYVTDTPWGGTDSAIDVICLSENSFAMAGQVNGLMGYIRLDLEAGDTAVAVITSHSNGEEVSYLEDVIVTVAAWDDDGIDMVKLMVDGDEGRELMIDIDTPYEFNLGRLAPGMHTLVARAVPVGGDPAIAEIVINVVGGPTSVSITSHEDGDKVLFSDDVVVTVAAWDDSGIEKVWLKLDDTWQMPAAFEAPYQWNLGNLSVGYHTLIARALTNDTDPAVAETIVIEVVTGEPTVLITSHEDGQEVPSSQDVVVVVDAWDNDGIERVWLRLDTIWLPSVVESPYTWNLGNLSAGYHTLEAMAVPNDVTDPRPTTTIVIRVMESNGLIELYYEDFEDGFGIFTDGDGVGEDVAIATYDDADTKNDAYILSGNASLQLRDNNSGSGSAAEMLDCSGAYGYERLVVEFDYVCRSMDAGESFVLEFWLNGSWVVVGRFTVDVHFSNGIPVSQAITMIQLAGFALDSRIRFRCDASGNADWVYIDEVRILAGDQ